MRLFKHILFGVLLITFINVQAQDIHFTMFDMSPLTLNPAFSGAFEGTFRVSGIYRDQWNAFAGDDLKGYGTPSIGIDAPIIFGFKKTHWVGVGAMLVRDMAGSLNLQRTGIMGSAAYHIGFDKKFKNVLTIGAQVGTMDISFGKNLKWESEEYLLTQVYSDAVYDKITKDNFKLSYLDVNGGLLFKSALNKKKNTFLTLGFSAFHINNPAIGLKNLNTTKLDMRFVGHAHFTTDLNDKWLIMPNFIYQTMASQSELILQSWAGYRMNKEAIVKLGLGYRAADAIRLNLMAGMDYKNYKFGLSYDMNLSSKFEGISGYGGLEIAVSYMAKIYKKPDVPPVILCPRL